MSNGRFGPLHPGCLDPTTIELKDAPRRMIRNGETDKMQHYSLDYLLGDSNNAVLDKELLKRLEDIESLSQDDKDKIYYCIDMAVRDAKTRQVYGS